MIPKHILEKVEAEADKMESALIATGEGDEAQAHWLGVGCDVGAQFMYELLSPEHEKLEAAIKTMGTESFKLFQKMPAIARSESLEARIKDLRAALGDVGRSKAHWSCARAEEAIEQDNKTRGGK